MKRMHLWIAYQCHGIAEWVLPMKLRRFSTIDFDASENELVTIQEPFPAIRLRWLRERISGLLDDFLYWSILRYDEDWEQGDSFTT